LRGDLDQGRREFATLKRREFMTLRRHRFVSLKRPDFVTLKRREFATLRKREFVTLRSPPQPPGCVNRAVGVKVQRGHLMAVGIGKRRRMGGGGGGEICKSGKFEHDSLD
jgi:hypothetical protein